jgi:hypothetical protein
MGKRIHVAGAAGEEGFRVASEEEKWGNSVSARKLRAERE